MLGEVGVFEDLYEDSVYRNVAKFVLVVYLLVVTVMLLNLLIAVLRCVNFTSVYLHLRPLWAFAFPLLMWGVALVLSAAFLFFWILLVNGFPWYDISVESTDKWQLRTDLDRAASGQRLPPDIHKR